MGLIEVGHRFINTRYLIIAERGDGTSETDHIPDGTVRITLETGRTLDLRGDQAAKFLDELTAEVAAIRAASPAQAAYGHTVPAPSPAPASPRKRRVKSR